MSGSTPRHGGGEPQRALIEEIRRIEEQTALRHDELRREKARVELDAANRNRELRSELGELRDRLSQVVHAQVASEDRNERQGAAITERLVMLERLQSDSIERRIARCGRGIFVLLRALVRTRDTRNVLGGARLLINADARRTWAALFDADAYYEAYPDVRTANVPAALHYLVRGYREGREPSERFSGIDYVGVNPDVKRSGMNPLVHYALFGQREARPIGVLPEAPTIEPTSGIGDPAAIGSSRENPPSEPGHRQPDGADSATVAEGPGFEPPTLVNTSWPDRFPLVSVVIPSYNSGATLRAALTSVIEQTWEDSEIIVVESDSSDPDTAAAIRKLEAERPPRTTFLYREGRRLVGDNRNFGIDHAHGRYVVCLDADDTLDPVYLEVALFLAEAYQYDLVYPSVQYHGRSDAIWPVRDTTFEEMLEANVVSVCALFRRSAWLEAGGFRDWGARATLVPEDWAFWTRLLGMGYRAKAIPQPLLRYLVREGGGFDLAWSSIPGTWRDNIRAANEDLLHEDGPRLTHSTGMRVLGGYRNLLAREPSAAAGGSVLVALPGPPNDAMGRLTDSLGEGLATEGIRFIIATTQAGQDATHESTRLRAFTRHVYELPQLFEERDRQEAFLLFLLQRYEVHTLVLAGSWLAVDLLPAIRRLRPRLGIIELLLDGDREALDHASRAPQVDLVIVPSEALRARVSAVSPTETAVIPPVMADGELSSRAVEQPHGDRITWPSPYRLYREAFARATALAVDRSRRSSAPGT